MADDVHRDGRDRGRHGGWGKSVRFSTASHCVTTSAAKKARLVYPERIAKKRRVKDVALRRRGNVTRPKTCAISQFANPGIPPVRY